MLAGSYCVFIGYASCGTLLQPMADGRNFLTAGVGDGERDGTLALLDAPMKAVEEVAGVDDDPGDDGIAQNDAILAQGISPTVTNAEILTQIAAADVVYSGLGHRVGVLLGVSVLDAIDEEHALGIEVVALGAI